MEKEKISEDEERKINRILERNKNIKSALEDNNRTTAINQKTLKQILERELGEIRKLSIKEKNELVRKAYGGSVQEHVNTTEESFFWQNRKKNAPVNPEEKRIYTEKLLEAEYPKMRKEIPECETKNKYGDAARKIEIQAFKDNGAVTLVKLSKVPKTQ